ncbi:MAG: glycosyltransferase [Syntrophales bacterium]|jgi:cellulose synthase/poly-beta-1,6-N-acetylglucosamine synthase-like glycosyltransferase
MGESGLDKNVSIIIPAKQINDYVREAIPHILNLDYPNFEIIVLLDSETKETFPKVRMITTGNIGPAAKRDMALTHANGEILAFIDDDAYPRQDWLKNAVRYFTNDSIGVACGPAITPPDDNIFQQASGKVYESRLCCGPYTHRYRPEKSREVDVFFPTVNFIVRKDVFVEAGGFDCPYYSGEDAKLCAKITGKLGKKIIYAPEILVWHHRRELFRGHLKQVKQYGLHRGYFARNYPETTTSPAHYLPGLFIAVLFTGPILSLVFPPLWYILLGFFSAYCLAILYSVIRIKNVKLALLTAAGIATTHIVFGINSVRGFFAKSLPR